jgi:hypothetical protein
MITLPALVRCWQKDSRPSRPRKKWQEKTRESDLILVFDTETTTDVSQRLLFGAYEAGRVLDGQVEVVERGLFHADDLPEFDPAGYEVLRDHAEKHEVVLRSRAEFWHQVLKRLGYNAQARVVGFNLPFDIGAIALGFGAAKGRYAGGFSFWFSSWTDEEGEVRENKFSPRIRVKHRNSTDARIGFTKPKDERESPGSGRFEDLRTLTFALSGRKHSLQSGAEAWGIGESKHSVEEHGRITPEYIDYALHDVRVTRRLWEVISEELVGLPVEIPAHRIRSSASLGKSMLRAMGVKPAMEKFDLPDEAYGVAMESFYGGRSEVRVRKVDTPVCYVDFLSMYPSVNALLGIWAITIAERVEWVEETQAIRHQLEQLRPAAFFDPGRWRDLCWFAEIIPNGDILPLRAKYDGISQRIGHNVLHAREPMYFAGPDLVASMILTGQVPEIRRAWRLRPAGVQKGLNSIRLSNGVLVNPRESDFFVKLIEQRKSLEKRDLRLDRFLKVVANSASYGITAEFNRQVEREETGVLVGEEWETFEAFPERPGVYCFPPQAALITAGARLLLAMLERAVRDRGGAHVFCDTDSMAIHVGPGGLSIRDVREIMAMFEQLKPYDPQIVEEDFLELEEVNLRDGAIDPPTAYAVSAKRYCLGRDVRAR